MHLVTSFILLATLTPSWAYPTPLPTVSAVDGEGYLRRFGYITIVEEEEARAEAPNVTAAIIQFQRLAAIPETGVLDKVTLERMKEPRCGVRDQLDIQDDTGTSKVSRSRVKRFSFGGTRWNQTELTWTIRQYSKHVDDTQVKHTLHLAFRKWSQHADIHFQFITNDIADIEVHFVSGSHNDQYTFDGKGGVVAHAFFPPDVANPSTHLEYLAGDVHFDDDEIWRLGAFEKNEQSLYAVALHEIGHALGVGHSHVKESVMWPWSKSRHSQPSVQLHHDDISAIQSLYGPPIATPSHFLCETDIEDFLVDSRSNIYAFHDGAVYQLDSDSLDPLSSKPISVVFPGLADDPIDAAVTYQGIWQYTKTYIFTGGDYYRFSQNETGFQLDDGYPKSIREGWNMDADMGTVFNLQSPYSPPLVFIKGNEYWIHTGTTNGAYPSFPKTLSEHEIMNYFSEIDGSFLHPDGRQIFKSADGVFIYTIEEQDDMGSNYDFQSIEWFQSEEKEERGSFSTFCT